MINLRPTHILSILFILSILSTYSFADVVAPPPVPAGYESEEATILAIAKKEVALIAPPSAPPAGVAETKDIQYGEVGGRALLLDIIAPADLDEPRPCIAIIHGGSWSGGDKGEQAYRAYAYPFAEMGYVVASIGYRLSGEAKYPAAVQDVLCAIRYLRANAADHNIDPDNVAAMGWSAGGHLALMAAYAHDNEDLNQSGGWEGVDGSLNFVVNMYGPTDLTVEVARDHPAVVKFMGHHYEDDPERYDQGSPLFYVDKGSPPTLTMNGTIDSLVGVFHSEKLAAALQEAGVPYTFDRVEGWPHVFDMAAPLHKRTRYFMDQFLEQYMPIE